MTVLVTFIAINALLWLVIASEAARRDRQPGDEPNEPTTHITRGPLR
jgi:hypothetical protein